MKTVALSMHDRSHAETHYLCEQGNRAQSFVKFRDVFFGGDPLTTAPRVHVVEALRHFHSRKGEFGLGPQDILVAVVEGNLYDESNDEYLFRTSSSLPDLKESCPGVGVISLFFRVDPSSEFQQPRSAAARGRKAEWWDPKGDAEKSMLVSNSFLLMILGLIATLLNGLVEHDDTRGCVMDYCQDPYDMLEAFKRGVEFRFCDRDCRPILERSEEGIGLVRVAERITARPYAQPQPSIFISYARDDGELSERLRGDLQRLGYEKIWKDVYEILGGVAWEPEIRSALEKHDFILSCLSTAALERQRFFQEEMRVALELHIAGRSRMVPLRFNECTVPQDLQRYHFIDLFPDWQAGITSIQRTVTRLWTPFGATVKKT
jgi:hypothetical protein